MPKFKSNDNPPNKLMRSVSTFVLIAPFVFSSSIALAQSPPVDAAPEDDEQAIMQSITVTTRRRAESLQDVPDAVTVFTADTIEDAGIDEISDFIELTPNITIREAFRAGVTFITLRGISTGQQGWAPVAFNVDGVPAGSLDAINQGALVDIERIEVLRGPQGALYGAGAIAGAINVITKPPTDEFQYGLKASIESGDNRKLSGSISGPLSQKVLFRIDAYNQDSDGNIETTDGDGVDFEEQTSLRGRLIFDLDDIEIDLRGHYGDITAGAAFQEFLPPGDAGLALLDDFENSPGIERGILGVEDRTFKEASAKVEWDIGGALFSSVTGYSELEQGLFGSTTWQRPPAAGFCGPVGGPGEPPDCFQTLGDDFTVFTQDLRLTSDGDGPLRWLAGISYLEREAVNLLRVGAAATNASGTVVEGDSPFLDRVDQRNDEFIGVYAQVNYDVSDRLEVTLAARYDENSYDSTQFTDLTLATPVATPDGVVTQNASDDLFQPKAQISYDWNDNVMTYATVARGFRTGFFNTGNLTAPEDTWNYEVGFKSNILGGRALLNGAAFHIDYSDQQFTQIISEAPFRATTNIPETEIDGLELELVARPIDNLNVTAGLGWINAEVADGSDSPFTPDLTLNASIDYTIPVSSNLDALLRLDYSHQGEQFLGVGNQFEIGSKDYLNARASLTNGAWRLTAFSTNLTDERQPNEINNIGFGFIRVPNKPRSTGIEVSYRY